MTADTGSGVLRQHPLVNYCGLGHMGKAALVITNLCVNKWASADALRQAEEFKRHELDFARKHAGISGRSPSKRGIQTGRLLTRAESMCMTWPSWPDPATMTWSRVQSRARAHCAVWLLSLVPSLLIVMGGGCASQTDVTRVDTNAITDLSGRWNDTDSRLVAETMVKEAIASHWLDEFTHENHRSPVVVVGAILNKSYEHIDTDTFTIDLERELSNAQAVVRDRQRRTGGGAGGTA